MKDSECYAVNHLLCNWLAIFFNFQITHCNDFCATLMSTRHWHVSKLELLRLWARIAVVMTQAIHHPWSKCEMSHEIRTWQENWASGTQVWQMCARRRGPLPRWQRQRLVLRLGQTDRRAADSATDPQRGRQIMPGELARGRGTAGETCKNTWKIESWTKSK